MRGRERAPVEAVVVRAVEERPPVQAAGKVRKVHRLPLNLLILLLLLLLLLWVVVLWDAAEGEGASAACPLAGPGDRRP